MAANKTEKQRNGFTFFRSFRDAIEMTPPDVQLVLYKAIADYALDQIEPDISTLGVLGRLCWTAMRPNIESGLTRFLNGCSGGAPKGNRNACKTTEKQPKINLKTTYPLLNENENENEDENKNECVKTDKRRAFVRPSLEAVKNYFVENGYSPELAQRAYDYYEAGNWKDTAGRPVRNWKQKMRGVWLKPEAAVLSANPQQIEKHETRPHYAPLL